MPQHPTHGPSDHTDAHASGEGRAFEAPREATCKEVETAEALLRSSPAAAEALARRAIQVCAASALNGIAGRAQHVLGLARAYQGDPAGSAAHLSLAVEAFAQAGCRRLEGVARCDRASIQGHHLGLTQEATAGFEQALKIAVEVGSRQDEGRALSLMGGLFGRIGQLAESERALRHAIGLLDEKLDAHSHASACNNLGHLLSQAGRFGEAVPILARCLERLDPEHRSMACTLRSSLALAVAHTGDVERALTLLEGAQLADLGAYDRVDHALTFGRVQLIGGRADAAVPLLRQALADAEQAGLNAPAAECLRFLSLAAEQAGDLRTALDSERKLREAERSLLNEQGAAQRQALETSLQRRALQREQQAQEVQHLALDRSRVLLRSIVDADDALIFAKDDHGTFVLANRAFLAYWDVAEAAVVGRTSLEVFGSTPLVERSLAIDEAVRRTGVASQIEQTVRTLAGERIMVTRRSAILSPDGEQWLLGVARDVTDTRQQEEVLRRQQVFTREVIDQDTNPICVKDAEMRYVLVNAAFARMHGVQADALLGRRPDEVFGSTDEVNRSLAADRQVLAEDRECEQEASVMLAGEQRHIVAVRKPIVTADGATGILGITRDLTAVRRDEQRLREAVQTAEAASEAKSIFLANMSHEIRTPINGIIGMVDLASRTESARDRQQYLALAGSSADTLLTIVNDILDFSKVEAGKMTVEQVPFSVHDLVNDLTRTLALRAADKQLRLLTQMAEDLPLTPVGDPTRLRQVLGNLLGNAIKFTDSGVVTLEVNALSAHSGRVQLRFAVRDTGIGISQEQQLTIFEAFTQADSSITRRFGGTGLGLAISARLVHLMGGRLELQSRESEGACFSFVLDMPVLTSAGPALQPPPAAGDAARPFHGLRILLAEDNPVNLLLAVTIVERLGGDIHHVDNGAEALALMQQQRFDLVLMDVQMPVLDGAEAVDRWRAIEAQTVPAARLPVIAMTAHALRGDRERFIAAGFDGYVSKPFREADLVSEAERVLAPNAPGR